MATYIAMDALYIVFVTRWGGAIRRGLTDARCQCASYKHEYKSHSRNRSRKLIGRPNVV
jgi:hypothetical protein